MKKTYLRARTSTMAGDPGSAMHYVRLIHNKEGIIVSAKAYFDTYPEDGWDTDDDSRYVGKPIKTELEGFKSQGWSVHSRVGFLFKRRFLLELLYLLTSSEDDKMKNWFSSLG